MFSQVQERGLIHLSFNNIKFPGINIFSPSYALLPTSCYVGRLESIEDLPSLETISKACIMGHRLKRMQLNFKYMDIMPSSSTWAIQIGAQPMRLAWEVLATDWPIEHQWWGAPIGLINKCCSVYRALPGRGCTMFPLKCSMWPFYSKTLFMQGSHDQAPFYVAVSIFGKLSKHSPNMPIDPLKRFYICSSNGFWLTFYF